MTGIEEIMEADLQNILNNNKVVIVDYSAVWCGPCRIQHMILEKLQTKYEGKSMKIVTIDIDKNRGMAEKIKIFAVPTLQIYHDGKVAELSDNIEEADRFIGVQGEDGLGRIVDKLLSS